MPNQEFSVETGKSIAGLIEHELDLVYAEYKSLYGSHGGIDALEPKGKANGLATALAILQNPYHPPLHEIKKAAHERWAAKQR